MVLRRSRWATARPDDPEDYIAEIRAELEREMGESTASYCVI